MTTKVFIGNLPHDTSFGDIEQILKVKLPDDVIHQCKIELVKDKQTGVFKGFAYVDVLSIERVEHVISLDGADFDGRRLRVDRATPKDDRRGSRGGGRGTSGRKSEFSRGAPNQTQPRSGGRGGSAHESESGRGKRNDGCRPRRESDRSRPSRKNSERKNSFENEATNDTVDASKPSERPRLKLTPMPTDPEALERKKQREAEEEAARRAKLFQV